MSQKRARQNNFAYEFFISACGRVIRPADVNTLGVNALAIRKPRLTHNWELTLGQTEKQKGC